MSTFNMKSDPQGVLAGRRPSLPRARGLDYMTLQFMIHFFRCQEKLLAPSQRQLPAGDNLPSPQSSVRVQPEKQNQQESNLEMYCIELASITMLAARGHW